MRPQPPFDSEWCAGVWKGPQVVTHFVTAVTGRDLWALCDVVPVLSAYANKGEFSRNAVPETAEASTMHPPIRGGTREASPPCLKMKKGTA